MIRIHMDFSELADFAADLRAAADGIDAAASPVVVKGATNIKNTLQADMSGSGSFGHAAASVSFDMVGPTEAEIGPTKPSGAIANIAYFGGANGGGGTVRDPLDGGASRNCRRSRRRWATSSRSCSA